ncbi:MAG: IS630 family transposase [Cyanobacteria bacterium J06638_22]
MLLTRAILPETQQLLHRIYRQSKHHQVRQRAHCLLLYSQGQHISQLLDIFAVSKKTVYNWVDAWNERGLPGLYNRPGRGRKATFNAAQKAQIKQWAQMYPRQLKQVVHKVHQTWNITISTHTIKRVLKSLKMSWHRFRRVMGGQPNAHEYALKQSMLEELKRLDSLGVLALYYLDETGFSLVPTIPYGWQLIGETQGIPSQRSRRLNVLGLMRLHGSVESYVSEQSITSDVVIACIDALLPPVDVPVVIVMDNASIHCSHAIRDQLKGWQEQDIYIFELPTYSPELNRIEILWRFMKYEWLDIGAYESWHHLVAHVENMLTGYGNDFVINFA